MAWHPTERYGSNDHEPSLGKLLLSLAHVLSYLHSDRQSSIQAIQPEQLTGRIKFEDIPQGYNYKTDFRYIQEALTFYSTTGMPGISLGDVLKDNLAGLADPNAEVMEVEAGKKISYAFEVRHASYISLSIINTHASSTSF